MAEDNSRWIKLYYELFDRPKWAEYEAVLLDGKRTGPQRRAAKDFALSSVIRLYLALGKTRSGSIDYRNRGERLQLERWMTMEGDELLETLDRMAECKIIRPIAWRELGKITTSNAEDQAEARNHRKDISRNANNSKRRKHAAEEPAEAEAVNHDGKP